MNNSKTRFSQPLTWVLIIIALVLALVASVRPTKVVTADHGTGSGKSFTFLQAGFSQEIVGVAPIFMGGVAFAPDGDPLVSECGFFGTPLIRFDLQGIAPEVNGTKLHPFSTLSNNAGCGLTNNPDGNVYTNTSAGVIRLDANTGAQIDLAFGPSGNALGITTDPQTGNVVYIGSNGTVRFVSAAFNAIGVFSTVTAGNFIDGIVFDPAGNFLLLANRSPLHRLTILRRDGTLVQHVPMSSEPDGVAFHASAPVFVVTNNLNGQLTRFDFPGNDLTQVPTQSVFASGGFRGDLNQVGPDGCLYLTQAGTRYDNNVVTNENSLVRICAGFGPGPTPTPTPSPSPTPPTAGSCGIPGVVKARPRSVTDFIITNDTSVTQTVSVKPFFGSACFSIFPGGPQQVQIGPGNGAYFTLNARNCPADAGKLPNNSVIQVETSSCGTRLVQVEWVR